MTLPYAEPLTLIDPADRVVPEPPRRGEEGGEPCFPCSAGSDENLIWADQNWTLHNPGQTGLPGSVWLASRAHFDSFADMPPEVGSTFAEVCGASSAPCWRSATWPGSTSTAGVTVARTSTSGSCRARSGGST